MENFSNIFYLPKICLFKSCSKDDIALFSIPVKVSVCVQAEFLLSCLRPPHSALPHHFITWCISFGKP